MLSKLFKKHETTEQNPIWNLPEEDRNSITNIQSLIYEYNEIKKDFINSTKKSTNFKKNINYQITEIVKISNKINEYNNAKTNIKYSHTYINEQIEIFEKEIASIEKEIIKFETSLKNTILQNEMESSKLSKIEEKLENCKNILHFVLDESALGKRHLIFYKKIPIFKSDYNLKIPNLNIKYITSDTKAEYSTYKKIYDDWKSKKLI